MRLHIIGTLFDSSGYSQHTRSLTNALVKLGEDVSLDVPKPADWPRWVNDDEMMMLTKPFTEDATTIMIGLPPFWRLALADNPKRFFGYVVWEGTHCPKYWCEYLRDKRVEGILVPSKHTKRAIANICQEDEVLNKVHIVPHGVDTSLFHPLTELKEKTFTFIANKGFTGNLNDRGGMQYIVEAFLKEFEPDEKVQLIAKINIAYGTPNIEELLQKKGLTGNENLKFNLDTVDIKLLPKLYNRGHCFISATRGDAFNLPVAEAMACGLPAITTNFGGQCDFVNASNGWLVDYKLEDVTWDVAYEGSKWGTPSITELRRGMRYVFEHQQEAQEKGAKALTSIKNYTWDNSAKQLLTIIKKRG